MSLMNLPVAGCGVWEAEEEGRETFKHTLYDLKGQGVLEGNHQLLSMQIIVTMHIINMIC